MRYLYTGTVPCGTILHVAQMQSDGTVAITIGGMRSLFHSKLLARVHMKQVNWCFGAINGDVGNGDGSTQMQCREKHTS